jgi:lysophospholipase L1-like esterase
MAAALAIAVLAWAARAQQAPVASTRPTASPAATTTRGASARLPQSTTQPVPRGGAHARFLQQAKQGNIDLLFFGDSITAGWGQNEVWKKYYTPLKAANFGIGGERTQHILWGIENGEVDGISPKVVVLLIGTNNLGGNTPEQIAEGITIIVRRLREKLPQSKVLLLGIFPREEKPGSMREKITQVNKTVSGLDDGKMIRYLDLGHKFMNAEGVISKEIMPDFLHLSVNGYEIWAESMQPLLTEMMGTEPK